MGRAGSEKPFADTKTAVSSLSKPISLPVSLIINMLQNSVFTARIRIPSFARKVIRHVVYGAWNNCHGMGGTFHKLFTGLCSSLAATAERLRIYRFSLKKKGYEIDKYNIPNMANKA
jgi:hypothetical protein